MALRRFTVLALAIALGGGVAACGGSANNANNANSSTNNGIVNQRAAAPAVAGNYPVQQASYNNSTGEYTLMLLNAPPGMSPYRISNLQMAQIPEAEAKAGKTSYLAVSSPTSSPVLHLLPTFKIEMLSGEPTQVQQAGLQPTYWQPMQRGGELEIDLDFYQPYYYVPPPYRSGSVLTGFGGYGGTYEQAAGQYQQRYNAPPAPVQNRNFRTTQNLRPSPANSPTRSPSPTSRSSGFGSNTSGSSPAATPSTTPDSTTTATPSSATRSPSRDGSRSTGAGFGSSTFRSSGSSARERSRSSGSSSRRSGFGSSGRRR
ncbi:hypothetical protein H6F46_10690 [Limnothrix sp. FACHB-1083]|nr:hypothetical protein [Limnothrix sp. FACHB-1083]MBD2192478.1 hypothetical protein [Limnothrix sp. FACHB-1088]